jgi:hypothetical protein
MASLATKVFPLATATKRAADLEPLTKIALFCGVGLLISISMILVYMHILPTDPSIGPVTTLSLKDIQANVDVNKLPNLEFEDRSLEFLTPARR